MIALHDLSAHELSTAYRTRRLSPVEVTRAVLSRIDAWEKRINAMYLIDAAGALATAAASEERWRRCKPLSAIDGVPITIKDNIAVKGTPAPFGTAAGDMTPSASDAPPTARVREAGCVLLGKTTMPDFGHAGVWRLQPVRNHAQSLESCAEFRWVEFRRGCRDCCRLWTPRARDGHRRFGAVAGGVQWNLRA